MEATPVNTKVAKRFELVDVDLVAGGFFVGEAWICAVNLGGDAVACLEPNAAAIAAAVAESVGVTNVFFVFLVSVRVALSMFMEMLI